MRRTEAGSLGRARRARPGRWVSHREDPAAPVRGVWSRECAVGGLAIRCCATTTVDAVVWWVGWGCGVAVRRESLWVPLRIVAAMLVGGLADYAINVSAGVRGRLPWPLSLVRAHPLSSWAVVAGVVIVAEVADWWLRRRDVAGLLPPELRPPEWVVDRPAEASRVVAALQHGGGSVGISTALHGAGGFGKTTLAKVVCADRRVRRRFRGGIFWLTVGRDVGDRAGVLGKINDVLNWVAPEERPYADVEMAGRRLGALLEAGPRRLLVLDDVWFADQLTPFMHGGRQCARLVTTRNPSVLGAGPVRVEVDQMTTAQARALLTTGQVRLEPAVVEALLAVTGRWALLVWLVNKILLNAARTVEDVSATGWELCRRLRDRGPAAVDPLSGIRVDRLDVNIPEQRVQAVRATIEAISVWGGDSEPYQPAGPRRNRRGTYIRVPRQRSSDARRS